MNKIFLIAFFISIAISFISKAESTESITVQKNKIILCLSALYTTEKSFYEEFKTYSDDENELGIKDKNFCSDINIKIYAPIRDQFIVYAKTENQTWSINEKKNLVRLKFQQMKKK